jgi:uncharacterized membrane protein
MMSIFPSELVSRCVWTGLLVSAATAHFVVPEWFVAYYPSYLPLANEAVAVSGIVEIVLAALLWIRQTRRLAWLAIMALMIVYIPVHVYVVTHHDAITHPTFTIPLWLAWVRLPMQGVLVWWAAWQLRSMPA